MPAKNKSDFTTKEIKLSGKLMLHDDPTAVGPDFVELVNLRHTDNHLKNIGGMTKVNTASLGAGNINTAFQYKKDSPVAENHILIHKATSIYDNVAAIPAQGNFGTALFTDTSGGSDPRFATAPGDKLVFCNGMDAVLWAGSEFTIAGFIDTDPADPSTYKYNYLDQLSNSLQDAKNVALLHNVAGTTTLYVGSTLQLSGVNLYVSTKNDATGSVAGYYWGSNGVWNTVGTVTGPGSVPLNTTGKHSWTFATTVNLAQLKSFDDTILYWYKFTITNLDADTALYQATLSAPFQQIKDIWDGVYRRAASYQYKHSDTYYDNTVNVGSDQYDTSIATTYAVVSGVQYNLDSLLIGSFERLMGYRIGFVGAHVNASNASITVSYWNGTAWVALAGVVDGTKDGAHTYAKSGSVIWTPPSSALEFKRTVSALNSNTNSSAPMLSKTDLYYYKIDFTAPVNDTWQYNLGLIPAPKDVKGFRFSLNHADRLWLCNEVSNEANMALCSSLDTSQILNGEDSAKQYFGDNTGLVNAVSLYYKYGSTIASTALFFKETQVWALDGDSLVGTTISSAFKPRLVSATTGLVAPGTLDSGDIELQTGMKRVAIWQSQNGIVISDGTSPQEISVDIHDLFDSTSTRYIGAAVLPTCKGFIDVEKSEYHWIIPGVTEYVFNLKFKKWHQVSRTTATKLRGGLSVYDTNGISFAYGYKAEYVWLLDSGSTFDTEDIATSFRFGDMAIDEGSIVSRTSIKSTKLIAVALASASNTIGFTHYGDGNATPSTFSPITITNSGKRIVGDVKPNSAGPYVFHSFRYTFNVNASNAGFSPVYVAINYSKDSKDL